MEVTNTMANIILFLININPSQNKIIVLQGAAHELPGKRETELSENVGETLNLFFCLELQWDKWGTSYSQENKSGFLVMN